MTTSLTKFGQILREGMRKNKENAPKQVAVLLGENLEYKGRKAKLIPRTSLPNGAVYSAFGLIVNTKPMPFYVIEYSTGNAYGGETPDKAKIAFKAHVDWEENLYKEYDKIFNS